MRHAYLPRRAPIHGEQQVLDELDRRTTQRGSTKLIAEEAGLDVAVVYHIHAGKRRMQPSLAEQLGFQLAWVRAEEIALADKIEAEMHGGTE